MPSHAMNIINLKKGGSPEPPPAYAPGQPWPPTFGSPKLVMVITATVNSVTIKPCAFSTNAVGQEAQGLNV